MLQIDPTAVVPTICALAAMAITYFMGFVHGAACGHRRGFDEGLTAEHTARSAMTGHNHKQNVLLPM